LKIDADEPPIQILALVIAPIGKYPSTLIVLANVGNQTQLIEEK
jgi:hypothetical protein